MFIFYNRLKSFYLTWRASYHLYYLFMESVSINVLDTYSMCVD